MCKIDIERDVHFQAYKKNCYETSLVFPVQTAIIEGNLYENMESSDNSEDNSDTSVSTSSSYNPHKNRVFLTASIRKSNNDDHRYFFEKSPIYNNTPFEDEELLSNNLLVAFQTWLRLDDFEKTDVLFYHSFYEECEKGWNHCFHHDGVKVSVDRFICTDFSDSDSDSNCEVVTEQFSLTDVSYQVELDYDHEDYLQLNRGKPRVHVNIVMFQTYSTFHFEVFN